MARNPFKPTAGATPPILVGRSGALEEYAEAIEDGPGAPGLLTIFTGPRGIGKTVMLTAAEDVAREHGWVSVSETATAGLLGRIHRQMTNHLEELGGGPPRSKITGVSFAGAGVSSTPAEARLAQWRETALSLLAILDKNETGLLITVDEIHAIDRSELAQLAADVQHLVRENLPVSLVMAGIPKAVSDLLNEDVSTFLRRADRIDLEDVPVPVVQEAFQTTFSESGVHLDHHQIDRAANATGGYPFLIQLVGYQIWRRAISGRLTDAAVEEGIAAAKKRLGSTVLQAALSDLSDIDKTFLLKMAEDDGPSTTADIATRLGETRNYVGVYRSRLIDAGVIFASGHGRVDFAIPYLRGYLREHAASLHSPK